MQPQPMMPQPMMARPPRPGFAPTLLAHPPGPPKPPSMDEPPAKKAKTEEQLIPEDVFLSRNKVYMFSAIITKFAFKIFMNDTLT